MLRLTGVPIMTLMRGTDARLEDPTDIASLVLSLASNRIDYVKVRCGGDAEQKYTEKFARLCEATYKDARQSFMEQRALGHPFQIVLARYKDARQSFMEQRALGHPFQIVLARYLRRIPVP